MGSKFAEIYSELGRPGDVKALFAEAVTSQKIAFAAPGGFTNDVMIVHYSEDGRDDALERLSQAKYFSKGAIFHRNRWLYLKDAFLHRVKESSGDNEVSWKGLYNKVYKDILKPSLYVAIQDLPSEISVGGLYRFLRKATRANIERDLLEGLTVDEFCYRDKNLIKPEEDTAKAQQFEAELSTQFASFSNLRIAAIMKCLEIAL